MSASRPTQHHRKLRAACRADLEDRADAAPETPDGMGSGLELLALQEELIRRAVRTELQRSKSPSEKLAYSIAEAAEATGYSAATLRFEIRRNNLVPAYANSKAVILKSELERWLESLPCEPRQR